MNKWLYLLYLIVFVGCSDQNKEINFSFSSSPTTFFNNKLKTGLEQDSLTYYAFQLDQINNGYVPDSLRQEFLFTQFRYIYRLGEIDSAINTLQYIISLSEPEVLSNNEAKYYEVLINLYYGKNDFLNCLGTSEKMISLLSKDDIDTKAIIYNYQQRAYTATGNFEQALKANSKVLEAFEISKDTVNIVNSKVGRASIYFSQNNLDQALKTLQDIKIDISSLTTNIYYQYYENLGTIQYEKGLYKQALTAFLKASDYITKTSPNLDKEALINNYNNISCTYLKLGKIQVSSTYIDSAYSLGINTVRHNTQKAILKTKLEIEINKQNNLDQIISELDSIFKYQERDYESRINSELAELKKSLAKETELKSAKKTIELKNLSFQRNQYLLLALLLTVILITTLIIFYNRQRKFKTEKENLLLQQRLLRSQMNPHFTFNSLSLIKNEIDKNSKKSSIYISKFSKILRAIFESSTKDYTPVVDEIELLVGYLEMQQFRFLDRFEYEINNEIVDDEIAIPPMLLQPFVENAINHGFKDIDRKGVISIKITLIENLVICTIEDNGIGFDTSALRPDSSVQLINLFLKKTTGQGISVTNKSKNSTNENGTLIKLQIPFKISVE